MTDAMQIDCTIVKFGEEKFIVPTSAFVEFFMLFDVPRIVQTKQNIEEYRVYSISWKNFVLPLVNLDLSETKLPFPKKVKIAIVHALYSKECRHPPYFALCFDTVPSRLKVSAKTIEWIDNEKKTARVKAEKADEKVTIIDLFQFSRRLEKVLSEIKNLT